MNTYFILSILDIISLIIFVVSLILYTQYNNQIYIIIMILSIITLFFHSIVTYIFYTNGKFQNLTFIICMCAFLIAIGTLMLVYFDRWIYFFVPMVLIFMIIMLAVCNYIYKHRVIYRRIACTFSESILLPIGIPPNINPLCSL